MTIQIESDLKEVLGEINHKLDTLQKDVTDINLRLTKVETKLKGSTEDIKDIKRSQQAQIWTLIGILITAVGGFLVAGGRFVLSANP
ncbi:MAG: hemolysin XhlA family protein [Prochloron sp. SP5CPC1]|nr:hemolysin XhlA family protein [Candidatus Paraprochloron terpiosi SP5CPC1]